MWEPQLVPLSKAFRVIAPDIRGFGASQPASPWTMEEMADDLNGLLDELGIDDCAVAGVSMGGYIALSFWTKYPERVRRLVLSNTRARADNEAEKSARTDMIVALEEKGSTILPDRMLHRLLKPNPLPDVLSKVRRMIEETSAAAAIHAVMAMRDRPDSSSLLHRMTCPAMVITGEDDVMIRLDDARALADAIPGAHFARVANSGHLSNLENPGEFNSALLDFLRR
jgi:3-oxoadipate enol-lactonase